MTAARVARTLAMQVRVEQRVFWRNASAMFFTFLLPLVLLVLVSIGDEPEENVAVIIALGILSTTFQGLPIQLAMHRDQGVLKGFMATPLSPTLLVVGKVLSMLLVVALQSTIVLAVGVLALGAPVPQEPLALVAFVLLGTATFTALGFAVASIVPTSDSAPAIVNAAYLGLILITVGFAQVDDLPGGLHVLADALPLGHLFVQLRDAWLGGGSGDTGLAAVVLIVWGLFATAWTARSFRWEPAESS